MTATKKILLATAVSAALGAAAPAWAINSTFLFNEDGTGLVGAKLIDTFDFSPGNTLATGAINAVADVIINGDRSLGGTLTPALQQALFSAGLGLITPDADTTHNTFTTYSQSSLGNTLLSGSQVGSAGTKQITQVMAFGETVTGLSGCSGNAAGFSVFCQTADFEINTSLPNFFQIWVGGQNYDNLAGTGFADGLMILEGTVISGSTGSFTTAPLATSPSGTTPATPQTTVLDQFNSNNYPGISTVRGSGNTGTVDISISSFSASYFPSLKVGDIITLSLINVSQNTPFQSVDPSNCFTSSALGGPNNVNCTGGVGGVAGLAHNIGTTNGLSGPDFQFQTDYNGVLTVPEPGSMGLLGLGMTVLGFISSRRRKV